MLGNNEIDDSGVLALMDQLTPLLPRLGCGFGVGIYYSNINRIDLCNNPVSSEMEKMLEEELRRRYEVRRYMNQF